MTRVFRLTTIKMPYVILSLKIKKLRNCHIKHKITWWKLIFGWVQCGDIAVKYATTTRLVFDPYKFIYLRLVCKVYIKLCKKIP